MFGAAFESARARAGIEVAELVEQVKHEGQDFLSDRKGIVAEQFANVSGAIRRAAEKLHDTDSAFLGGYVDRAADTVETMGKYIEERDAHDVIEDVGVIARRQPLLFAGGMFLAGLAAARFVKAAAEEPNKQNQRSRKR